MSPISRWNLVRSIAYAILLPSIVAGYALYSGDSPFIKTYFESMVMIFIIGVVFVIAAFIFKRNQYEIGN